MTDCFCEDADKRPVFQEIDTRLKRATADSVEPAFQQGMRETKNKSISL
jgi:hypothetical protein